MPVLDKEKLAVPSEEALTTVAALSPTPPAKLEQQKEPEREEGETEETPVKPAKTTKKTPQRSMAIESFLAHM